jgi:hypothetical protein
MVIDLGKADVLVREQPQFGDCDLDAGGAGRNAFEQGAQLLLVDDYPPSALVFGSIPRCSSRPSTSTSHRLPLEGDCRRKVLMEQEVDGLGT